MALAHVHPYPLTVDQFLAIPGLPERTELIQGVIYEMTPEGIAHARPQSMVQYALKAALPDFEVFGGGSLQVSEGFCPIPDVAVYYPLGPGVTYPSVTDLVLVVEVGVSSAVTDRTVKAPAYTGAHGLHRASRHLGRDRPATISWLA